MRPVPRGLKAHTKLDTVTRHYTLGPFPKGRCDRLLKDDQGAKDVQDIWRRCRCGT